MQGPKKQLLFVLISSIIVMFLHKVECYYTNEYNVCPVYQEKIMPMSNGGGVAHAIFLTFCFWFFLFLVVVTAIFASEGRALKTLLGIWILTFVHEIHHPIQTLMDGTYYSGTITAYLYTLVGAVYVAAYAKVFMLCGPYQAVGMYAGSILAYSLYLTQIENSIVKTQNRGLIIDREATRQSQALKGKVCVITGANRGIGKAVLQEFASLGAKVIMACRDVQSARAARDEVRAVYRDADIVIIHLDLEESSDKFFENLVQEVTSVDFVVLNAGIYDGTWSAANRNYDVNYVSNRELLYEFLPVMAPMGKIMLISSSAMFMRHQDPETILTKRDFQNRLPLRLYGDSKYLLFKYSRQLPRQRGVTINAFHPGVVNTGLHPVSLPDACVYVLKKLRLVNQLDHISRTLSEFCSNDRYRSVDGKYFNVHMHEKIDM